MLLNGQAGDAQSPATDNRGGADRRQSLRRSQDLRAAGRKLLIRFIFIALLAWAMGYLQGKGAFNISPEGQGEAIHVSN